MFKATEGRWGSREVEITEVAILGRDGVAACVFQAGDPIEVQLKVRAHQLNKDFVFGFGINADGICCYGTNTNLEDLKPREISGEGEVRFKIDSPAPSRHLQDRRRGAQAGRLSACDYHRLLYTFRIKSPIKDVGVYRPDHHLGVHAEHQVSGRS